MRLRWKLLVAAVAGVAFVTLVNAILVGRETKEAAADIGRIMRLPGGDLQVREDGPGGAAPIVLINGFTASMRWWDRAVGPLARDHRVIRVDLLGHGGSEKPRGGYSIQSQARLIALLLRRLRVRRAVVVGHSMGGEVAVALATADPELVRSMVIVDTLARPEQARIGLTGELLFVPIIGPTLYRTVTDGIVRDALRVAFAPGHEVPDFAVEDFRRMTYSSYDQSGEAVETYVRGKALDDRAAETGMPLLVIFGDEDQLVDPAARHSYEDVAGARVEVVQGAGHSPMFEKPQATTRLILEFAQRRKPSGRD